jgi:TatD DNase family protein
MNFFDSHSHVNFKSFENPDEIVRRALTSDTWMINVGSQIFTSKKAVELAQKNKVGVYSAVGLHPIHISEEEVQGDEERYKEKYTIEDLSKVLAEIKNLVVQEKVVAIGEVGLDYFHFPENCEIAKIKKWQKKYLEEFIKLAIEIDKPLILHCRGDKENPKQAYLETLEIIKQFPKSRGVIHCFGSDLEIAKKFIEQNFLIGITGIITFKNSKELQEVAKNLDLAKILIETDCPYLAPIPHRGEQNEPIYVKYVAQKIAEIKGLGVEEVGKITFENAKELFGV